MNKTPMKPDPNEALPLIPPITARTKPDWDVARCAAVLALNTTMRGCELKGLRWKDVDFFDATLTIQRHSAKTDVGNRVIPLNKTAVLTLAELKDRADKLGSSEPQHFVFPACESGVIEPTKPMEGGAQHGGT